MADYFAKKLEHQKDWLAGFLSFVLMMGVVFGSFFNPPEHVNCYLWCCAFAFLWISGLPPKYLIWFAVIAICWLTVFPIVMEISKKQG